MMIFKLLNFNRLKVFVNLYANFVMNAGATLTKNFASYASYQFIHSGVVKFKTVISHFHN